MQILKEGQRFKQYRILHHLGSSISGTSYEAEDIQLQRKVTLKLINPWGSLPDATRRQFFREMQDISTFTHPYLAAVLDYGEAEGQLYIARRFLTPGSLLGNEGRYWFNPPLDVNDAISYTRQLAEALYFIHSHGYLHGALNFTNILVTAGPQSAQQADFAPFLISDIGTTHFVRRFGQPQATFFPITTAPEQFGKRVTEASDQYALAVILYFWLTGRPPFIGTPDEIEQLKLTETITTLTAANLNVPLELEGVIRRALSVYPEDRYPSIMAFADALHASIAHLSQQLHTTFTPFELYEIPQNGSAALDESPLYNSSASNEIPQNGSVEIDEISQHNSGAPNEIPQYASDALDEISQNGSVAPDAIPQYTLVEDEVPQYTLVEDEVPQYNPVEDAISQYNPVEDEVPQYTSIAPLEALAPMEVQEAAHDQDVQSTQPLRQVPSEPLPQVVPDVPQPLHEPSPDPIPLPEPEPEPKIPTQPLPKPATVPLPVPGPDIPQPMPEPKPMPPEPITDATPRLPDKDIQNGETRFQASILIASTHAQKSQEIILAKRETTVGRAGSSDILLDQDNLTSRHHALLKLVGNHYEIYDLKSANGIQVNGYRIPGDRGYVLTDGDYITIGEYELTFRLKQDITFLEQALYEA